MKTSLAGCALILVACSSSGSGTAADLPLTTPPARAAAPAALGGTGEAAKTASIRPASLDSADLRSRFFQAGPTSIWNILASIDGRIGDINSRSTKSEATCLSAAPVEYELAPFGGHVKFFAQCYETFSGTDFLQFGKYEGITYVYSVIGAGPVAARITPKEGGAVVHAWIAVTDGRTTGGSYGVIELEADSVAHTFEMSVAGTGFGYCGAQLSADAARVRVIGSPDMGASCVASAESCLSAANLADPADCTTLAPFALPSLGRAAHGASGASTYPTSGLLNLDGTPSDATAFGPTAPTAGVGAF